MMVLTKNMLTVLMFTTQASTHPHHLSNEQAAVSNDTVVWRKTSVHRYYSNSSQLLQCSTNITTLLPEYSGYRSQSNLTMPCNHTQSVQLLDTDESPRSTTFAKVVYIACFVFGMIGLLMLMIMLVTQFLVKHCTGSRAKQNSKNRRASHASADSEKLETWKEVG